MTTVDEARAALLFDSTPETVAAFEAAIRAEGLDVERVTDETRGVMRAMERLRTDIKAELASVGRSHDEPVWKQGAQAAYQWVLARLAEAERSKPSFDPFALDSIPDD